MFQTAKWIWLQKSVARVNEYAEFIAEFSIEDPANAIFRICSKTDYAFFINGKFVGFHQFQDYPEDKIYDEYLLNGFVKQGENRLAVIALSGNYETSSRLADGKGVIFEIFENGHTVYASNANTLSRLSPTYRSGGERMITVQLGMSFHYDMTGEDAWKTENVDGFSSGVIVSGGKNFRLRPIKRMRFEEKLPFTEIKKGLYDCGAESVGYLFFDIDSEKEQEIRISYGEHITDGCVRRIIGSRDFSVTLKLRKGNNVFQDYFLRLGLRYLQIEGEGLTIREIGITKSDYPVTVIERKNLPFDQKIYDVCVHTLRCCMHDHYEDCPWREQAQYTMDSRTQILCGYYAFGEREMPAAALRLMAARLTKKGVFPITSPCNGELSIPNFSLVYPLMLSEYYEECGDKSVLADVFENTEKMIEHYIGERQDGLLPHVDEWNFYEWADGLDNGKEIEKQAIEGQFDLPLNAFFVLALENFAKVCRILGKDEKNYAQIAEEVKIKCRETFFEDGLFKTYCKDGKAYHLAEYTQVVALFAGIADESMKQGLYQAITTKNNGLVELTLNGYIFKYDVLLRAGGYTQYVLDEIQEKWGYMLAQGATTFWETIKGDADFENAGSLCHGWSAVPVYVAKWLEENK